MKNETTLTMDEIVEKITEYLGDLSEGTPPYPPDLETCQAIYLLLGTREAEVKAIKSQEFADRMDADYGGHY